MLLFSWFAITEDTSTEKRRLTEPNFVALLADESPDAAIITTAEGTVAYWNKGAESIFEYTSAEAAGRPISELIVPDAVGDTKVMAKAAHSHWSYRSDKPCLL